MFHKPLVGFMIGSAAEFARTGNLPTVGAALLIAVVSEVVFELGFDGICMIVGIERRARRYGLLPDHAQLHSRKRADLSLIPAMTVVRPLEAVNPIGFRKPSWAAGTVGLRAPELV